MESLKKTGQRGFTIVELLIATMVFSLILLLATYALLHVGNTYTKGTNSISAQDTARDILENLSQAIQFNGAQVIPPPNITSSGVKYCFNVGPKRYTYIQDRQLVASVSNPADQSNPVFVSETTTEACPGVVTFPSSNYTELLNQHMRIANLRIKDLGNNLYTITIRIVYGDGDLLNAAHDNCNLGAGSQFCAASELTTTVEKRI